MKNNKIHRRLQCLCLALLLMFTIIGATPVFATGVAAEVTFGEVMSKVGDEITVPVTIKNNPGIAAFRFRITYDTEDLEFVSVEKGSALSDGTMSSVTNAEEKTMTFTWLSVTNDSSDGEIALLKFKVLDTARGEYPLTVTYLPEDLLNEDLKQVPYTVVEGKISTGITISGTITSFGDIIDPVTLKLLENGTKIDEVTSTDGSYRFSSISPGSYVIEVSKINHTTRNYEITVEDEDISKDLKIHLWGDVSGDGKVNVVDVAKANAHAKKTVYIEGYEFLCADINCDGKVNVVDVAKMNAHAKKTVSLW